MILVNGIVVLFCVLVFWLSFVINCILYYIVILLDYVGFIGFLSDELEFIGIFDLVS